MTTRPAPRSPLELLHPAGPAGTALVLGDGCPAALLPAAPAASEEAVDLVVVAPSREQEGDTAWLEEAAARASRASAPDAVVYLLGGRRTRLRLGRLLRRRGLTRSAGFLHVPERDRPRHLVQLERAPLRFAAAKLIPLRARNRRLLLAAASLPLLGGLRLAAAAGSAVRAPDSRPLLAWLPLPDGRPVVAAIVTPSPSRPGSATFHCFAGDAAPAAVVKLAVDEADAEARAEAAMRLRPSAAAAGARVPHVETATAGGRQLLLETALDGTSAYAMLMAQPQRFDVVARALGTWLERWNARTATETKLTEALVERRLLTPARLIEPLIPEGPQLRARLERLCEGLLGTGIRLVAAHGDLTMSNVLLLSGGRLGIVDWEHGDDEALPTTDLLYALADAAAAPAGYADRVAAARACFEPGGRHEPVVSAWRTRLEQAAALGPAAAELCFHACWLHHAANEATAVGGEAETPFLELVRWAARRAAA